MSGASLVIPDSWDDDPGELTPADEHAAIWSGDVLPNDHGSRLDKWLALQDIEGSRAYFQQAIEAGDVTVAGAVATKTSHKLKLGERVTVRLSPKPQDHAFEPEPMDLDIRWEDEHLLVLHKPAGLVVHPAAGNWSGTLMNGLLAHHPLAPTLPRAGIVHRLDKDTSGLMLVAKTRAATDRLTQQIASREVNRVYVALVKGAHPAGVQSVKSQLGRDARNRLRMAVLPDSATTGKWAHTDIKWLDSTAADSAQPVSWVSCKLHTGRTHQIRVHLTHLKHPLVGDAVYGGPAWLGMTRQALHAVKLGLVHPITGEQVHVAADLPSDMAHALDDAGLGYNPSMLWSAAVG